MAGFSIGARKIVGENCLFIMIYVAKKARTVHVRCYSKICKKCACGFFSLYDRCKKPFISSFYVFCTVMVLCFWRLTVWLISILQGCLTSCNGHFYAGPAKFRKRFKYQENPVSTGFLKDKGYRLHVRYKCCCGTDRLCWAYCREGQWQLSECAKMEQKR